MIIKSSKEKKEKYLSLKSTINFIRTVRYEKEFDIAIIASIFENRLLTDYKNILKFCTFITGEEVDLSNLHRFSPIIINIILEQYPTLKVLDYSLKKGPLDYYHIKYVINWYIKNNGNTLKVKSVKKGRSKKLTQEIS